MIYRFIYHLVIFSLSPKLMKTASWNIFFVSTRRFFSDEKNKVYAPLIVCIFSCISLESNILGRISSNINKSNLNFKYETLEKATDFFNPSRKLGQGGAGSVFKGTLPDGKTVAVKRLFFNTRQWVDEFFNEVNLISGIQHKNLVKLLGCSIEGPESLLVYEFVPNKSLEQFLFG